MQLKAELMNRVYSLHIIYIILLPNWLKICFRWDVEIQFLNRDIDLAAHCEGRLIQSISGDEEATSQPLYILWKRYP